MTNEIMKHSTASRKNYLFTGLRKYRVNKLSKLFKVSTVTIGNDLRHLEQKGCVLRSYGGQ